MPPPWGCGEVKPIGEFALLPNDHRCRECKARENRITKENKERKRMEQAAREIVAATAGKLINIPHITQLVESMYRRAGGFERFTESWWGQIEEAMKDGPGSKRVLDAFAGIARLNIEASKMRETAPDVVNMEDDELVEEMVHLLATRGLVISKPGSRSLDGFVAGPAMDISREEAERMVIEEAALAVPEGEEEARTSG